MHYIHIKKQITWAMCLGHNLDDKLNQDLQLCGYVAIPEEWKSLIGHFGRKYNELKKYPHFLCVF